MGSEDDQKLVVQQLGVLTHRRDVRGVARRRSGEGVVAQPGRRAVQGVDRAGQVQGLGAGEDLHLPGQRVQPAGEPGHDGVLLARCAQRQVHRCHRAHHRRAVRAEVEQPDPVRPHRMHPAQDRPDPDGPPRESPARSAAAVHTGRHGGMGAAREGPQGDPLAQRSQVEQIQCHPVAPPEHHCRAE